MYSHTITLILFIIITISIIIKPKFAGNIILDKVIFLIIHWQFIDGTTRLEIMTTIANGENKEEYDKVIARVILDELKEKLQVWGILLLLS